MSTNTLNGCRFYPVQCTNETFATLKAAEGHLYFVTDKKKLYLGKNGQMIPMCATSGTFYGHKAIEYIDNGQKPEPRVDFLMDEIEGEDIPEVDDLILNIGTDDYPDGCFYRVNNVDENNIIETTRLTLQGTGGGGSSSGPVIGGENFSFNLIGSAKKVFASTATSMDFIFKCNYLGTDTENHITQVSFVKSGETEPFYVYNKQMAFNEQHTIDLISCKDLFNSTTTTVYVYATDTYGTQKQQKITIQIIELSLKKTADELLSAAGSSYTYSCQISGATSGGISDKKITYTFYNEDNLNTPVLTLTKELSISDDGNQPATLDLSSLGHGVYVMRVIASVNIGTTIYSNELTHKIAHFITSEPLLMIKIPEVTEQYTNIPLHCLLVTNESNKEYTLDIKLNGVSKTQLKITSNQLLDPPYDLYFETKGNYTLLCTIVELAISHREMINITPYSGNLPIIDPTRDDLMLYLNPREKSNDSTDRDIWKDYNGNYTATLNNLHYGSVNGWMKEEDGSSYLKLSSGASLRLNDFLPFKNDPTKYTASDSRMGYGMTIELDFEIRGVLDYDTEIIKCISTNKDKVNQVGFAITGNKVIFYNSRLNGGVNDKGENVGSLMSLNIIEGKRIRLSFVIEPNTGTVNYPMCYTYLDGKLSAAVIYGVNDAFKDSTDNPAKLQILSDDAQVKIYGVRVYSTALTDKVILNNYTASLPTLAERENRFNSNNVFDASGKVDYMLVAAEDYDLQIPYMKITGGWATEKDSKWQLKNQTNANVGLPTGKKDYRLIDVEVKYPKNEYFANYKDYKFVNEFKSGKPMAQAYGEKPSNGGAIMYAQGTSSMEYPVKNLRLRFNKVKDDPNPKKNFYRVRPDIEKVEIICMKADYMESSGSHNTGAANLVDALYTGVGMKTPGQEHFGGEGKDTIVTCIKGHPCLIFYSESGMPGTYKYIGKYNLNLDKATPEPFGFDHDDDIFGYLSVGDEYYDIPYDDEDKYAGKHGFGGPDEIKKTVQEGEKVNSIHCFEFLDNAVEVCNFLPKKGYTYEQTWYGTFKNSDNEDAPGWTLGFESRYPEDKVGYHDADALYPLASWLNELYNLYKEELAAGKDPKEIEYKYNYLEASSYQEFVAYYIKDGDNYIEAYPTAEDFASNTYYTRTIVSSRFDMDSLERFKREYQCYLDKDFLLTYYLVTEALLMADSRVKNMMIATWHKKKHSYVKLDGTTEETNNYIFYPIFYDMDTMLGLDNTGVYRFEYFDEDTDSSIFNGDEVLWNFVRDALKDELAPWYSELEGALLTANGILPYFNKNQANMANEAFYNGDAAYKYTGPAREGYYDHLNGQTIAPGAAPYLYAAQGDRSLMREWFINNRMSFLRGKYNSSKYQSGDRIDFRWYYPTGTEKDEALNASCVAVPPTGTFKFTSLKTGYAGVKLGANGNVYNERFEGEQTKEITLPEASSANGTEAYLLGLGNLTDLGDLSTKYMQKFIIKKAEEDVRLKHLTLGNAHKDYHNPYWRPGEAQAQEIKLDGCTYLETFNLQNCSSYNNLLNFSFSPAIKQILLTGSSVSDIILPMNGVINELRLPTTIRDIKIVSHPSLNKNTFSLGRYDYKDGTKIGESGEYLNDFSGIRKLYVVDTPIDTYEMARQAGSLEEYYLINVDWEIKENDIQYCKISANQFDSTKTYYSYDSNTKQYIVYEGEEYPENLSIYEKYEMVVNGQVVCIPILEYLQTKTFMEGTKHADALSGVITLNISGAKANQLELYQKYINVYPNLEIRYGTDMTVEGAYKINFYRVDADSIGDGSVEGLDVLFGTMTSAADNKTLAQLIDTDRFSDPVKSSTVTTDYSFTGMWYDWKDNKTVYYQDSYFVGTDKDYVESRLFSKVKPTKDMSLVPKFDSTPHIYNVNFYDYNYESGAEAIFTIKGKYQDNLDDLVNEGKQPLAYYVYRPDTDLEGSNRYTFKGWETEADFNNNKLNPTLVKLNEIEITDDLNFFAYYEVEDAATNPSDLYLFKFEGSLISIKEEYRKIVGGKLTLPNNYNGTVLTTIKDFAEMDKLKEVYFLSNGNYTATSHFNSVGSFQGCKQVEKILLPDTITSIGRQSFSECNKLTVINLNDNITSIGTNAFYNSKVIISKLPDNLITLENAAFLNAGPNVTVNGIPNSLNIIPTQCFMGCPNVAVNYLPEREDGIYCEIGGQAFSGCAKDNQAITSITINKPWAFKNETYINSNQIFGAGYLNVRDVYINSPNITGTEEEIRLDLFTSLRTDTVTLHMANI